jgi:hypothetical protein
MAMRGKFQLRFLLEGHIAKFFHYPAWREQNTEPCAKIDPHRY